MQKHKKHSLSSSLAIVLMASSMATSPSLVGLASARGGVDAGVAEGGKTVDTAKNTEQTAKKAENTTKKTGEVEKTSGGGGRNTDTTKKVGETTDTRNGGGEAEGVTRGVGGNTDVIRNGGETTDTSNGGEGEAEGTVRGGENGTQKGAGETEAEATTGTGETIGTQKGAGEMETGAKATDVGTKGVREGVKTTDAGAKGGSIAKTTEAETHKNVVAKVVNELLTVAENETGIGAKVRAVANEQNATKQRAVEAIDAIEKRNPVVTFLVGADTENVEVLKKEITATKIHVAEITVAAEGAVDQADKKILLDQAKTLKQEQARLEKVASEQENAFSLFGWVKKIFK